MKTYGKYKASGIEWVDSIPMHWQTNKFSRVAFFQEGPGLRNWQFKETGVKVICVTNITEQGINFDLLKRCISEDEYNAFYTRFTVAKGDYLLSSSGASWGKVAEYLSDEKVILNTSTIRINTLDKNKFDKRFIKWLINSPYVNEQLSVLLTGSCQPNFGPSHLAKLVVVYPEDLNEQKSIANFLDKKTTEINTAISKKQQLIQLLHEEKEALISEAVTKGINPDVPLKETGIDWLDKIPEHWQVKRLRFLCKITTGAKNTEDRVDDGMYPFFVRSQTVERINSFAFDGEGILTAGDGVGVGKVFHYVNGKFDFHQRVYLFYNFSTDIKPIFLFRYMQCNLIKELIIYNAKSTVDSVRLPVLQDFQVAFPNTNEQNKIITYIEDGIHRIDSAITKIEKEIILLEEYKAALIYEAVTGKIDVTDTVMK